MLPQPELVSNQNLTQRLFALPSIVMRYNGTVPMWFGAVRDLPQRLKDRIRVRFFAAVVAHSKHVGSGPNSEVKP